MECLAKATWGFLGFVLVMECNPVIRMSKARKFGWTGYQDMWESSEECLDELGDEKIIRKTTYFTRGHSVR